MAAYASAILAFCDAVAPVTKLNFAGAPIACRYSPSASAMRRRTFANWSTAMREDVS